MVEEDREEGATREPLDRRKNTSCRSRRLAAHFVDEVTNITLSANGACRLHFATWSVEADGTPVRVDSELIATRVTLERLGEALESVFRQSSDTPLGAADDDVKQRVGRGLFGSRS